MISQEQLFFLSRRLTNDRYHPHAELHLFFNVSGILYAGICAFPLSQYDSHANRKENRIYPRTLCSRNSVNREDDEMTGGNNITEKFESAIKFIFNLFDDENISVDDFGKVAVQYFDKHGFTFRERMEVMDKVNTMRGVLPLP